VTRRIGVVLLIALGLAGLPAAAGAQDIGVKGGAIFNTFDQANITFKNRAGLIGGLFFGGNRKGPVGMMTEVLVAKKGAQTSGGENIDVTYLEIPILLRINIGSGGVNGLRVYGVGGPAVDIKLKATQGGADVSSSYRGIDIDLALGAGVEVARLSIEGRWTKGFRNIQSLTTTSPIHTRSFAVLVGFRFQ
jgi:hypothetical protein